MKIYLPLSTILRILATLLIVFLVFQLAPLLMTLFIAVMLAVSLTPFSRWLLRIGFPRWAATGTLVLCILAALAAFLLLVLPPLSAQVTALVQGLPNLKQTILANMPQDPKIRGVLEKGMDGIKIPEWSAVAEPVVMAGRFAMEGIAQLGLVLVFAVYLVVDGPRTLNWLFAFFGPERRLKLELSAHEIGKIISAYVAGQAITSLVCGLFSLGILSALHVPGALMLAVLAGVFDVLPVLGFFVSAIPAIAIALSVSKSTALIVALTYIGYHMFENYILVPKIYGNRLRLSDLTVMVALIAAGSIAGLLGAIAVLPLVASYPIIERIWLSEILGKEVIEEHGREG